MTLQSSTLKFRRDLIEKGMSEELAEAVINGVHEVATGDLASKADLADLKTELKGDMADIKAELKGDMADLKTDIAELRSEFKWLSMVTCGTFLAVVGGVLKLAFFP